MKFDREKLIDLVLNELIPINSLPKSDQDTILRNGIVLEYEPGQYLFEQGGRDEFSYFLLEGKLEMQALEETTFLVTTDTEHFKYELAKIQPRQYSAKTLTTVIVLQIKRELLDSMTPPQQEGNFGSLNGIEVNGVEPGESPPN